MTPTAEENIETSKEINIVSYTTNIPNLLFWIWVFLRILRSKDRAKFVGLIVICVLMIISLITSIITWQLNRTYGIKI